MTAIKHAVRQWIDEKVACGVWKESSAMAMRYRAQLFVRYLKEVCRVTTVDKISRKHLDDYRKQRFPSLSAYTQCGEYHFLTSLFSWFAEKGMILSSPVSHWPPPASPKAPLRYLSVDQIQLMLSVIDTGRTEGLRDRAMLEMLYATAMRRQELIDLDLADVDLAQARVWIRQGKGDKGRIVPLVRSSSLWVRKYLKIARPALQKRLDIQAFFLGQRGARISQYNTINLIKYLRQTTGIKHITTHTIRHSCATHLMHSGVPLPYIQIFLGHENIHTTERYLHVFSPELRKDYDLAHPRDKLEISRKK